MGVVTYNESSLGPRGKLGKDQGWREMLNRCLGGHQSDKSKTKKLTLKRLISAAV